MAFAGMKDQAEIASLWTYLARFNADGSSKRETYGTHRDLVLIIHEDCA